MRGKFCMIKKTFFLWVVTLLKKKNEQSRLRGLRKTGWEEKAGNGEQKWLLGLKPIGKLVSHF